VNDRVALLVGLADARLLVDLLDDGLLDDALLDDAPLEDAPGAGLIGRARPWAGPLAGC
jgi:hypothetical protein